MREMHYIHMNTNPRAHWRTGFAGHTRLSASNHMPGGVPLTPRHIHVSEMIEFWRQGPSSPMHLSIQGICNGFVDYAWRRKFS
jgi:hypothetical protein